MVALDGQNCTDFIEQVGCVFEGARLIVSTILTQNQAYPHCPLEITLSGVKIKIVPNCTD